MRKVEVVPYNSEWPHLFEVEASLIKKALGDNCLEVHHIGSTAVPGLAAKPIIDIIPVVKDTKMVDQVVSKMEELGYEARGENGILFRRFFQKNKDHLENKFHLHIFEHNTPDIERHLKFRDWMRNHPSDREAYAVLKEELATLYPEDILSYVFGKDAFVAAIDTKTGFKGTRITKALTPREWEKVRKFRQKYFSNQMFLEDSETSTFEAPDHLHYLLYQESEIVGYLHLQLLEKSRSALHVIFIDEEHRGRGLGKEFLTNIERWLREQGIRQLHVKSAPEGYPFYLKQGYHEMPSHGLEKHQANVQNVDLGKFLY